MWLLALPLRFIAWVYQPDRRDRAGIGEARIVHNARERREAWDRLLEESATGDGGQDHRNGEGGA